MRMLTANESTARSSRIKTNHYLDIFSACSRSVVNYFPVVSQMYVNILLKFIRLLIDQKQ